MKKAFIKEYFDINNKSFLITGANGKLVNNFVKFLTKFKIKLILKDKFFEKKKIKKFQMICKKNKIQLKIIKCDFSNNKDREKLILNLKNTKIDVIINNATYTSNSKHYFSKFKFQNVSEWKKIFEVNLTTVFDLIKELQPCLKKSKKPSIINIASIYGIRGPDWEIYKNTEMGNPAAYAISKAGIIQLTRWLANTLAPKTRVNSITLGGIFRNQPKSFVKKYKNKTPLKRMGIEKDVNGAILYLSSNLSNYVTGANLVIDGGISTKI